MNLNIKIDTANSIKRSFLNSQFNVNNAPNKLINAIKIKMALKFFVFIIEIIMII
jgi:hypothetical protein